MHFRDRRHAGRSLAARLQPYADQDPLVLGLPRGGVPVAAEVAAALGAPLDVLVVRKLGAPGQAELAIGAVGEGDVRVVDTELIASLGTSDEQVAAIERRERDAVAQRSARFRAGRSRQPLTGRTVVIVDDGIATGSTMRAACAVARAEGAGRIVVAVPVAPTGWERRLGDAADELIALDTPRHFMAVGQHYDDFDQTTDAEVLRLLDAAPPPPPRP